jgi:hypothetical protein
VARSWAAALLGAALGLAALAWLDAGAREGHVVADGRWDTMLFRGFSPWEAGAGRVASPDSELVSRGLWPDAPIVVTVTLASGLPHAQLVTVYANNLAVAGSDVGGRFGALRFTARADGEGALRLRFVGDGAPRSALRVARADVEREGSAGLPLRRLLLYAGLLLGAAVVSGLARGTSGMSLALPLALAGALGWAIRSDRLVVIEHLPLALTATGFGLAGYAVSRLFAMTPGASAWVGAALGLRALLSLHPAFPGVDLSFHAHNLWKFVAGQTVTSRVADPAGGGMLGIPYPPLLYALLSPFASSEGSAEVALRVAMLVLEGSAPWLVLGLARATGAPAAEARGAAVALAVMPEGLLVLAKGVAANVLGSWLSLLVLWAIVAGVRPLLLAPLMAAAFLAHPGAALTLSGLVLLYTVAERRAGHLGRGAAGGRLGAGLAAAGVAWLAYYRAVAAVILETLGSLGSHLRAAPGSFFAFRSVHVLKIAQNLILKLGAGPVVLAVAGLRRNEASRAKALAQAWLWSALGLAALAVMTPLAFRFEYFAAPAVALAAGLGAAAWEREGRGGWVTGLWALSFGVQAAVGVALLLGRFEIISVIIPSPRWAWPVRLW